MLGHVSHHRVMHFLNAERCQKETPIYISDSSVQKFQELLSIN